MREYAIYSIFNPQSDVNTGINRARHAKNS